MRLLLPRRCAPCGVRVCDGERARGADAFAHGPPPAVMLTCALPLPLAEAFKVFLEATEDELAAVKAKLAEKKQHRGFMEWLSDTVGG